MESILYRNTKDRSHLQLRFGGFFSNAVQNFGRSGMKRLLSMTVAALFAVGAAGCAMEGDHDMDHDDDHGMDHAAWSYEGETGPAFWASLSDEYAACGAGTQQSPIDIDTATVLDAQIDPVVPAWNPSEYDVVNNGHTIQVDVEGENSVVVNGAVYNLAQFHFHHPSEHTIDAAAAPMEAHFVHMASDGQSAAVIGVMIEEGEENPVLAQIWGQIPAAVGEVDGAGTVDPNGLLPASLDYYNYAGSLTTPPCSEIIDWVVLQEPITASKEQIDAFAALYPMNARPVQDLNRRKILAN